jgi:hypothetical protein
VYHALWSSLVKICGASQGVDSDQVPCLLPSAGTLRDAIEEVNHVPKCPMKRTKLEDGVCYH